MSRHLPAPGRPVPVSTYRVQLHAGFPFAAAAAIVPYLAELGVTHLYCSPYLQAAPGSPHGYDVVDHSRLSTELGGDAGHARLIAACRAAGLGLVLDVVPNHTAVGAPETLNRAWWDLLKHGPDSAYHGWFDVDWSAPSRPLMPILGDQLGACLDRGEITYGDESGGAVLRYYDHVLPVAAGTEHLRDDLLALLDAQHYRLCWWRVAAEELNYRRFFDITTLAGLRVEDPAVFEETHGLVLAQVRAGVLDGLRIDHPDGLADPAGYLRRLADATAGCWVVVEKILERTETLPDSWSCAGSTGYDALNRLTGMLVDPGGEDPLTTLYGELTGAPTAYPAVVEAAKRLVLREVLAAEVNRLTDLLVTICRRDRMHRDHTRRALREALVEVLAAFGVYRAYVEPTAPPAPAAVAHVDAAAARARAALPRRAAEIELIRELALGAGAGGAGGATRLRAEFVTRFQQTCGPVMAKGVEDTAFYRYHRLDALNEVGGDPGSFGVSVGDFVASCVATQHDWPLSMTALSTHDTKRGEDVRARLAVLSELPREWAEAVAGWMGLAERHKRAGRPDRNTEYLLYQTLVGAWPLDADRLVGYLDKASREAKHHTSWTEPDPAYDAALAAFARALLDDRAFVTSLTAFVARVAPFGRRNALTQKLVQLTMPGVPDVYQGTELETLSLVDPDNRRPVDYDRRRRLLAKLDADSGGGRAPDPDADDGRAKLLVVSRALRLRRDHPRWFGPDGDFTSLSPAGARAGHLVAFVRAGAVVTVAPRLPVGLHRAGGWGDTTLPLPPGRWRDVLTGAETDGGDRPVEGLLAGFPAALLIRP